MTVEQRLVLLECLKQTEPSDEDIIELLIYVIDDWEIRHAVTQCIQRRKQQTLGSHLTAVKQSANQA